jgi:hypothetical protein
MSEYRIVLTAKRIVIVPTGPDTSVAVCFKFQPIEMLVGEGDDQTTYPVLLSPLVGQKVQVHLHEPEGKHIASRKHIFEKMEVPNEGTFPRGGPTDVMLVYFSH